MFDRGEHARGDRELRWPGVGLQPVLSLTLLLALGGLAGCVRRYVEPAITEPHATVKIRVLHHERSGPQLDLTGRLAPDGDEYGIDLPSDDGIRVVRVRLLPTRYRVASSFFHTISQMRTVYVTEQYACGTTMAGYGTHTYSQTQYCSRQVARQQWETVRIGDGDCDAIAYQPEPIDRAVYLLQYDYFGPGVCSLSCMRQIDTGAGTFRFVPCGVGEPPVEDTSGGESGLALTIVPPPPTDTPFVAPVPPPAEPFVAPSPTTDAPFVEPEGAAALGAPAQP